jgi:hypothetical protein
VDNLKRANSRVRHTGSVQPDVRTSRQWSTPIGLVLVGWALVAVTVVWWLAARTATDRLFVGILVLALAITSGYASLCRPRLCADANGVAVRGLRGTRHWPWLRVNVRVERHQRLGRPVEVLELEVPENDAPGGLIIFTRLDLGEDPHDVAATLRELQS